MGHATHVPTHELLIWSIPPRHSRGGGCAVVPRTDPQPEVDPISMAFDS